MTGLSERLRQQDSGARGRQAVPVFEGRDFYTSPRSHRVVLDALSLSRNRRREAKMQLKLCKSRGTRHPPLMPLQRRKHDNLPVRV